MMISPRLFRLSFLALAALLVLAGSVFAFETGGGPDSSGVDQNSPKIGDCSAPDSDGRYKVSTCLPSVEQQLKEMGNNYVTALMFMATEFTAIMMQQMEIVGTFFDAKEQLEMQRDIQVLAAEAQKDYHPSEQLCAYGSGIRSLANTEERGRLNQQALSGILVKEYSNNKNTSTYGGFSKDMEVRLAQFKKVYCDPDDNNGTLWEMCYGTVKGSAGTSFSDEQRDRFNRDIDYRRTLEEPMTLDVDFTDSEKTNAEEDLIALARNLYWDRAMESPMADKFDPQAYLAVRSLMARESLAHNSFATIVGMKSKSPAEESEGAQNNTGGAHLKAFLRDFGMTEDQINEMYGENPSYYAQMDILTRTIYQHPNFYTNLYDKPANVDRINAAMTAIRLMQLRDRYDSQQRREMLTGALLEESLTPEEDRVYSAIQELVAARK